MSVVRQASRGFDRRGAGAPRSPKRGHVRAPPLVFRLGESPAAHFMPNPPWRNSEPELSPSGSVTTPLHCLRQPGRILLPDGGALSSTSTCFINHTDTCPLVPPLTGAFSACCLHFPSRNGALALRRVIQCTINIAIFIIYRSPPYRQDEIHRFFASLHRAICSLVVSKHLLHKHRQSQITNQRHS